MVGAHVEKALLSNSRVAQADAKGGDLHKAACCAVASWHYNHRLMHADVRCVGTARIDL
jgi:hypothetical protein